ncbi:MAG: tlde1 domain-containing protein [Allorhizobium sp.]
MAFSTETHSKGQPCAGDTSRSAKGRKTSRSPVVIGVGLAAIFWVTAGIATVHSFLSQPKLEAPSLTLAERPAEVTKALKRTDRNTPLKDAELARIRIAAAVAATEEVGLLMLPASMALASVEKSDRMLERRERASSDPKARDMLRLALAEAVAARNAQAIAGLGPEHDNRLETGVAVQTASIDPAALAPGDRLSADAAGLAATPAALAYAAPLPAKEAVALASDPREEPFVELLSETPADDHSALPDDVPLPSAKPRAPASVTQKPDARVDDKPKVKNRTLPSTMLAYAKPENPLASDSDEERPSLFSRKPKLPGRGVAVYDISAGVVHMPNGEKLKASSGRGKYRDNPNYVHIKNRGATPPNVYSLRMREARFHGVEAIRMTPVGDAKMYGRDGFLTHTYLLRVPGDSSGCVVFADYRRFLNAFKRGQVKTLIVVPRMTELPKYVAMM